MPTLQIPSNSPLHTKLVRRLDCLVRLAERENKKRHDAWQIAEERTLAYVPESEADSRRRTRRQNGDPSYTTLQIPYSYALLMSAHTYWTNVFFARAPVHQYSGRHGEAEMQVQAVEALIDYQVGYGGAMMPYYGWLYDAGKYGCGILGHYWEQQKLHYGELVEMTDEATGKPTLYQTTQEVIGFTGNRCYNISPFDFMHDPRVTFKNFQKGEFCCVRSRQGWNQIIRRKDAGYYNDNIEQLRSHSSITGSDSLGSSQLERPAFNTTIYDDETDVGHPAGGVFWEVYVDLIPKEWGIGTTNYPQKWCFTITEDLRLIVGASPLGQIHSQFPIDVLEPEVENYGLFVRGYPEIIATTQNTIDWLLNTHFYNVRAALNNQFIVDPSKLVIKDVQKGGPGFIWRLRPEAYGTDLKTMFMQVPVQDVTKSHLGDMQMMLGVGERTLGVNDQMMGVLNQGGGSRKTATEVRTSTGFGVNRQKTITEYMSFMGMAPHAQKLLQNSQQFYDGSQKLRIVGNLALDAGQQFINVTRESIAGYYDFINVDGTMPVDRMAQANLWKEIMANATRMPQQVLMQYDWARIFGWAASLSGLKNIQNFKVQVMPDQQLQQQAQAGNVIPMPSQGGRGSSGNAVNVQGMPQLSGPGGQSGY